MNNHWILDEHHVAYQAELMEWADWFAKADRVVRQDNFTEGDVSTVFLGLDHNYSDEGDPQIFETMVFDSNGDEIQCERYATWDQAEAGHKRIVRELTHGNYE